MKKFKKTIYKKYPAIRLYGNHTFCQRFLCRSNWFKNYYEPKWEWNKHQNLNINGEKVSIIFESSLETYIVFESENFQNQVFDWIQENNFESPLYWKKLAHPILNKLKSNKIFLIKEGLSEFKDWVNNYNQEYVDNLKYNVDLSIFEYNIDDFEEGNLWTNHLFDQLLEKYKDNLNEVDLKNLITALFNPNEEYLDCRATYTAINYLLEKRTNEIEDFIIEATLNALEGYEPGHRYFEQSLLDKLVDEIFPTFSPSPIIKLLDNAHPDNIRGKHYGGYGDNFISLAHISLKKKINNQQRKKLTDLIKKYTD
ncbi:hypothetical protein MHTCC0001_35190 [Flavobacteriaceae bacterium MHTCC 0001]